MELKAKGTYHNSFISLIEGDTTTGMEIPEEVKVQMLSDFPELFEALEDEGVVVKTPEDKLAIETPEEAAIETPEEAAIETPEDKLAIETPEDKLAIETPEVTTAKPRKK